MSGEPPRDDVAVATTTDKPRPARFRKPFNAFKLTPDQARRQGRISQVAWAALDGRDAVMAYLNTHDDALGARPLDLAVGSDDGLLRVEEAIRAKAPR
jgi:hypothetical protein